MVDGALERPAPLPDDATAPRFGLYDRLCLGYLVLAVAAAIHKSGSAAANNYRIFSRPFFLLLQHKSLYEAYPELYADTNKYSPTFALLMGPLAVLPDLPALALWSLLNAAPLFLALRLLLREERPALIAFAIVAVELLISLQNYQVNGLVAALMLLSFVQLERGRPGWAAFFVALNLFIKIFGAATGLLFVFYPRRRRFLASAGLWTLALGLLPAAVIPVRELLWQYANWMAIVKASVALPPLTVMGILDVWFGLGVNYLAVQLAGLALLVLPLLRRSQHASPAFRASFAGSVLIFVVIFNQMSESPTFVLAATGIALWYVHDRRPSSTALVVFVFLFSSLVMTEALPRRWRWDIVAPYVIKVIPVAIAWLRIQYDLLTREFPPAPAR
jgi:hypothetical protein